MLPLTALFAKTRDAGGVLSPHLCIGRITHSGNTRSLGYFRIVGLRAQKVLARLGASSLLIWGDITSTGNTYCSMQWFLF